MACLYPLVIPFFVLFPRIWTFFQVRVNMSNLHSIASAPRLPLIGCVLKWIGFEQDVHWQPICPRGMIAPSAYKSKNRRELQVLVHVTHHAEVCYVSLL